MNLLVRDYTFYMYDTFEKDTNLGVSSTQKEDGG